MMVTGYNPIAKEICDALGLKHVRRLDLHFAVDEIATIEAEFFPEIDGVLKFPAILKKYHVGERLVDVTCIGDETRVHQKENKVGTE